MKLVEIINNKKNFLRKRTRPISNGMNIISNCKKIFLSCILLFLLSPILFILLSIFSLLSPNFAFAAAGIPEIISFQGRLMNSSGALLGGPSGTDYCYKFSIYDAVSAGTKVWPSGSPTGTSISTVEGVFNAQVGGGADTLDYAFTDDQAFLQVDVATKVGASCTNGDETYESMSPRQQIVSSAYAITAGNALTLNGATFAAPGAIGSTTASTGAFTTVNGLTITANGTNTLNIAAGKTLTVSDSTTLATNSITLGGGEVITFSATNALSLLTTGSTSVTFPTTGTLYGTATDSITSLQLKTSISDETGSGALVFGTSPAFTTSITTPSTSFDAFNTTATTLNFAGAATGTATVNNAAFSLPNATTATIGGATSTLSFSSATGVKTISTGGTTNLNLAPGGNVGIGDASPTLKLDVAGKIGINDTQVAYLPDQATLTGSLVFGNGGTNLLNTAGTDGYYNTFVGLSAGTATTTGTSNTAIGYESLTGNTTGDNNTAIGYDSLKANTTGANNTAIGSNALLANNGDGNNNTATGYNSLTANTTGDDNVAYGESTLFRNITGGGNTAVGRQAGYGNVTLPNIIGNTLVGFQVGYGLSTDGNYNTLLGYQSGFGVTTGADNVLIGKSTLAASYNQVTTGSGNIAIGNNVAVPSATASNQLVIGNLIYGTGLSGTGATVSTGNIGIGTTAPLLKLDVAGSGRFTGAATSVLTGSIDATASTAVVGVGTLFTTELVVGDRITVTGETRTVTAITDATNLTVDTAFTDTANDTSPDKLAAIFITRLSSNAIGMVQNDLGNVGIGTTTPTEKLDVNGNINLATTSSTTGQIKIDSVRVLHTYGTLNFFAGALAGTLTLSGAANTGVGFGALTTLSSGGSNSALGYNALNNVGTGTLNTAVGAGALTVLSTGSGNVGIGSDALLLSEGSDNVAVGYSAGAFLLSGVDNVVLIGTEAGYNSGTGYGSNSVIVGYQAGYTSVGTGNIFLGYQAGYSETGDNKLYIENSDSTTPLIYGDFSTDLVGIGTTAPTGKLAITQTATATGVLKGIVYTGAVNTNQTLSTEIPAMTITTAGRQWATGALATQREVLITQPTYSFVGASTITDAATVGIAGAPIQSTNATITNTHGILVQAGAVSTATNSYGLTVNAQTGATNNYSAAFLGGNVGIGTTAPGQKLEVYDGSAKFGVNSSVTTGNYGSNVVLFNRDGTAGNGSSILFQTYDSGGTDPDTGASIIGINTARDTGVTTDLAFGTSANLANPTEKMRITSAGNVGIGVTDPDNILEVVKNQNGATEIDVENTTDGTSSSAGLRMTSSAGASGAAIKLNSPLYTGVSGYADALVLDTGSDVNNGIILSAAKADANINMFAGNRTTSRLFIDGTNGNVGIGTTAPGKLLMIESATSGGDFRIYRNNATPVGGTVGGLLLAGKNNNATPEVTDYVRILAHVVDETDGSEDGSLRIDTMRAGTLTEAMRVDNLGNVGIGNTAPAYLLDLKQTDAGTNDIAYLINARRASSGTVANGFGNGLLLQASDAAGSGYNQGAIQTKWLNATTRTSQMEFLVRNGTWGGTPSMVIDNSGNVGIGTTAPGDRLHVNGASKAIRLTDTAITNASYQDLVIGASAQNVFSLGVGAAGAYPAHLSISGVTGNVGIGTTTPGAKLDVKSLTTATNTFAYIGGGTDERTVKIGTMSTGYLNIQGISRADLTTRDITLQNDGGNVGIGITAPQGKLSFSGASDIVLYQSGTTKYAQISSVTPGAGDVDLRFYTSTDAGVSMPERMTIAHDGNVGIGTTTPGGKLELSSDSSDTTAFSVVNGMLLHNPNTTNNTYSNILFTQLDATGGLKTGFAGIEGVATDHTAGSISGYLRFGTRNNAGAFGERLRIDTEGNVGIGTTNPGAKFEVADTTVTGSEVVTNGAFTSDTTGWTGVSSTLTSEAGGQSGNALKSTNDIAGYGSARQGPITVVVGQRYYYSVYQKNGDIGGSFRLGTSASGGEYVTSTLSNASWTQSTGSFIATTATLYIFLGQISNGIGNYVYWDQVTVKPVTGGNIIANGLFTGGGTTGIKVAAAGNVGIGTTTPLLKLDVAGSERVTGTATSVLTGTIDPAASTTVTGVNTLFTTELVVGDRITVTGETRTVTAITSNTSLTVDTAFTDNANDTSPDKLAAEFIVRDSSNNVDLIVQDSGNVGIGTVGPSSKLSIQSAGSATPFLDLTATSNGTSYVVSEIKNTGGYGTFGVNSSTGGYFTNGLAYSTFLGTENATALQLITNNTVGMTILSGGNVGIGTTAPGAKLNVSNTGYWGTGTKPDLLVDSVRPSLVLYDNNAATNQIRAIWNDSGNLVFERSAYTADDYGYDEKITDMIILNTGNVGIGVTAPLNKLSVDGTIAVGTSVAANTTAQIVAFKNNTDEGNSSGVRIEQDGTGDASMHFLLTDTRLWQMGIDNSDSDKFKLGYAQSSSWASNSMTWDTSGNVGIGTTSPALRLQVYNNAAGGYGPPASSGTTQTGLMRLQSNSTNVLDFGVITQTSPYGLWLQGTDSGNLATTYPILLNPNGGNVGIGTTAPQGLLDVQGAAGAPGILYLATKELTVVSGDKLGQINFNAPLESDGTDAILVAGSIWSEATATFSTTVNTADLVFATAVSETATEKMRLTSAGSLVLNNNTAYRMKNSSGTATDVLKLDGDNYTQLTSGFTSSLSLVSGQVNLIPAGTSRFWVTDTKTSVGPDGSATTPAFTIGAHNDTGNNIGFFSPGEDILGFATGGSERARIDNSGNFVMAATNSSDGNTNLCWDGTGSSTWGGCTSLGIRKTNVENLSLGLETLRELRPVTFEWKSNLGIQDLGFIAEEVAAVNPLLAEYTGPNGALSGVKYNTMSALLTKAVQELDLQVMGIDLKVTGMEERLAALEANAGSSGIEALGEFAMDFFNAGVQSVVDGIAYMKGIVTEKLTVGSREKPTGITLFDKETGEPNCFYVENGQTKTTLGECVIFERESDNAENPTSVATIDSILDGNSPIITLDGDSVISIALGETYTEPGASATDNVDGEVAVIIKGSVDTSTPGTYTIAYSATNSAGSTVEATRTVEVVETTSSTSSGGASPTTSSTTSSEGSSSPAPAEETAPASSESTTTSTTPADTTTTTEPAESASEEQTPPAETEAPASSESAPAESAATAT